MASIISYPSIDKVRGIQRFSWAFARSSERKVDTCESSGFQNDTFPDWHLMLTANWDFSQNV